MHQAFQVQGAAGVLAVFHLLRGEELQGVLLVVHRAAADRQALFRVVLGDAALADQFMEDFGEIQPAVLDR
ncbi:hypothetical protein D3C81_906030 [compost metagenome]